MSESVGPSPSSLSRSATTEGVSSTSFSHPKPKRHVVPTTATSMPRPLHLALGSVVGSSSSPTTPGSQSPSPGLLPQNGHNPTSSAGGDNTLFVEPGTPGTSRAPSLSPLSPTITSLKRHSTSLTSKRQSSISYIPANGQSQAHGQRASVDEFTRSPLSTTTSFFGDVGKDARAGLTRSSSLGRTSRTPRSPAFPERTAKTNQSLKETGLTAPNRLKDRPPATLTEKHAELLHFIAQKESKCLELRSQLAVHEAELLQLKRKWERIVNRGFERSQTLTSTPSSSALPVSASLLSTSPSSSTGLPPNHPSPSSAAASSYFTGLTPAANAPGAVVLEGIKGGVQGMSRLIAAGLESIVHVNGPSTPTTPSSGHHEIDAHTPTSSNAPHTPNSSTLRMESAPGFKHWARVNGTVTRAHGHGQKESQSSSSTTTSAASSATFASLSSTSTRTSTTSAASTNVSVIGSSTSGDTTRKSGATTTTATTSSAASIVSGSDIESEFGDFEDGRRGSMEHDQEHDQEQDVLMVYDTGATPTMSPNPHFRRKKSTEHVHVERLVLSPPTTEKEQEQEQEEFDWDDGWDEPVGGAQAKDNEGGSGNGIVRQDDPSVVRSPKSASSVQMTLAPPSVPGLGALNVGTPTTQQMSYWVGSVGKKWDEIKGSTTFTKSQKRASLLLTDMQNSIVSALTSPPTSTVPLFGSNPNSSASASPSPAPTPASPALFSSNASHATLSPRVTASVSVQPRPRSATSLLDDSDDDENGSADTGANHLRAKLSSRMMAPVMVPDSLSPTTVAAAAKVQSKQNEQAAGTGAGAGKVNTKAGGSPVSAKDDEDEWNW
ncbi:hypothetical protein CVT25_000118 [Psilocybe cyanescens]|uniref:Uncharacterized protein n=1 Tax=Psilocybe cyanescens TaxID=93625 RepID=A0A409WZ65_PSICY|nr:hypothetical protein CVT25_000118 [Psilocybe cyanescens]